MFRITDDKIYINDKYYGSILKWKLNIDQMVTSIKTKKMKQIIILLMKRVLIQDMKNLY